LILVNLSSLTPAISPVLEDSTHELAPLRGISNTKNILPQGEVTPSKVETSIQEDPQFWNLGESVHLTYDSPAARIVDFHINPAQVGAYDLTTDAYASGEPILLTISSNGLGWDILALDDQTTEGTPLNEYVAAYLYVSIPAFGSGSLEFDFEIDVWDNAGTLTSNHFSMSETSYSIASNYIDPDGYLRLSIFFYGYCSGVNSYTKPKIHIESGDSETSIYDPAAQSGAVGSLSKIRLTLDKFVFVRDQVEFNTRSEYQVVSPKTNLHRLTVQSYEFVTTIQIHKPIHWNFSHISPNCVVSTSGEDLLLDNVIPLTYEVFFTSESEQYLAISDISSDFFDSVGFEGGNDWTNANFSTVSLNTTTVQKGTTSLRLSDSDASNDVLTFSQTFTVGYYYLFLAYYFESSAQEITLSFYDAGAWEFLCILDSSSVDRWSFVKVMFNITTAGGGERLRIRSNSGQGTFFLDSIQIYQANTIVSNIWDEYITIAGIMNSWSPIGILIPVVSSVINITLQYSNETLIQSFQSTTDNDGVFLESIQQVFTDESYEIVITPETYIPYSDSNYKRFKDLEINSDEVEGDLTNFPVLINIYDSDLKTHAQSSGSDIMFYSDSFIPLDFEIDFYNSTYNTTHAHLVAWVKMNVTGSAGGSLKMFFGEQTSTSRENQVATWSNGYLGVYHFSEDPGSSGTLFDSLTLNNGTADNMESADLSDGQVGKTYTFDGSNERVTLGDIPAWETNTGTVSAWVRIEGVSSGGNVLAAGYTAINTYYQMFRAMNASQGAVQIYQNEPGDLHSLVSGTPIDRNGEFHHVVLQSNGTHYIAYSDGVKNETFVILAGSNDGKWYSDIDFLDQWHFGVLNQGGSWYGYFTGKIDESRITDQVRSESWIVTEYNNQRDPDSFHQLETMETNLIGNTTISFNPLELDLTSCEIFLTNTYGYLVSENNTFLYRIEIDDNLLGYYYDLEPFFLNLTVGTHTINATPLFDIGDIETVYYPNSSILTEYSVSETGVMKIIIHDQSGFVREFDSFKTYIDSVRLYDSYIYYVNISSTFNLTITDLFDNLLYQNTSEAFESFKEIQITLYSVKLQNLQENPIWLEITRDGKTHSEWIFSYEIAKYSLEAATYGFKIYYCDSLASDLGAFSTNGSWVNFNYAVSSDSALMVTGETIKDVFDNVLSLTSDLTDVNASLSNQIVNVEISIDNVNTSISNQIVNVDINLTNINTTLGTQLITLETDISNVNSTLFAQTVQILTDISNVNSTLFAQTVQILTDISNVNATLYAQDLLILTNLANANSTLHSQLITILTDLAELQGLFTVHFDFIDGLGIGIPWETFKLNVNDSRQYSQDLIVANQTLLRLETLDYFNISLEESNYTINQSVDIAIISDIYELVFRNNNTQFSAIVNITRGTQTLELQIPKDSTVSHRFTGGTYTLKTYYIVEQEFENIKFPDNFTEGIHTLNSGSLVIGSTLKVLGETPDSNIIDVGAPDPIKTAKGLVLDWLTAQTFIIQVLGVVVGVIIGYILRTRLVEPADRKIGWDWGKKNIQNPTVNISSKTMDYLPGFNPEKKDPKRKS
jgi:hypothetical protein